MRVPLPALLTLAALVPHAACGQPADPPAMATATTVETTTRAAEVEQAGALPSNSAAPGRGPQEASAVQSVDEAAIDAADTASHAAARQQASRTPIRSEPAGRTTFQTRNEPKGPVESAQGRYKDDQSMPEMDHSKMGAMGPSNMPGMSPPPQTAPQ